MIIITLKAQKFNGRKYQYNNFTNSRLISLEEWSLSRLTRSVGQITFPTNSYYVDDIHQTLGPFDFKLLYHLFIYLFIFIFYFLLIATSKHSYNTKLLTLLTERFLTVNAQFINSMQLIRYITYKSFIIYATVLKLKIIR